MFATIRWSCANPKSCSCNLCNEAVRSPAADSKTSERAAWNTTSVFLGIDPARAVERLLPRSASIGSTRVAIHAGAMPKTAPVSSEMASANDSTGMDGDALMGTPAKPSACGNAKYRIRLVPA